jgi:hypothetical protein
MLVLDREDAKTLEKQVKWPNSHRGTIVLDNATNMLGEREVDEGVQLSFQWIIWKGNLFIMNQRLEYQACVQDRHLGLFLLSHLQLLHLHFAP